FLGGAVGWLGYELAARFEPRLELAPDGSELPDLAFLFVDRLLAWDHADGRVFAIGLGMAADSASARARAERAAHELAAAAPADAAPCRPARRGPPRRPPHASLDRAGFERAVARILRELAAGHRPPARPP